MLIQVLKSEIPQAWNNGLKIAIEQAIHPGISMSEDKSTNIQSALLNGDLQAWVSMGIYDNKTLPSAIMTTSFTADPVSKTRNLKIYSFYSFRPRSEELWKEDFEQISRYAKENGCDRLVFYTDVEHLVEVAKKLGATSRYYFVTLELAQ